MPDRPVDDDVLDLIERMRTQPAEPARDHVVRARSERRVADRRGLGFTARRSNEAERNRQLRTVLLSFLRQLPVETLWAWIDGLWLGCATDAHLAVLMQALQESAKQPSATVPRVGRRAEQLVPGEHRLATRYDWHVLTEAFKDFSHDRQKHRARSNRKRNGKPLSLVHRESCLASPLGQRVERAGLFTEFFDALPPPIPTEMAAKLLHYERRAYLTAFETNARAQALQRPSDPSRKVWHAQATKAAALRKQFSTWETLYRKLRAKPDTKQAPKRKKTKRRS